MFWKRLICSILILNHIWLGCAQATYSITGLSDAETQAEEYAWKHLAQRRVQIDSVPLSDDPDSTFSGLRIRAFKTQYHPDYAKKQEEGLEEKTQILQQETEFDLLQTILNPSVMDMEQLLHNMTRQEKGVEWDIAGLKLFVTWNGKVKVLGGETDSISLETQRSIKFLSPVAAKSLTLMAEHCAVYAPLIVKEDLDVVMSNPLKGMTVGQSKQGRKGILQGKNISLHEGSLNIHQGGYLSLDPGGILDLQDHDLRNNSVLEIFEEASVRNIHTLRNRGIITGNSLHLQGQELNNQLGSMKTNRLNLELYQLHNRGLIEADLLTGWIGKGQNHHVLLGSHLLDLEIRDHFTNFSDLLSPQQIKLTMAGYLDNQGDIVSNGSLALKGEGSLLNRGTLQSGTEGKLSLKINKVVNTRLIKSEGEMLLNPGKEFLNEQGGWVNAFGSIEIKGNGTLINRSHQIKGERWLNPDLEGAGFSPEADLLFHDFQGKVINEGSWATKGKVSGFLHHLENNGHWRAGMTELEVGLFLNHFSDGVTGGLVDAPGRWKIRKGNNDGILQGEYLHVNILKEFNQSERGAVKTENLLKFDGEGILNLKGKALSNREILLDAKEIEMSTHVQAPKITLGEKVVRWVRQEAGDWIFKTLSLLGAQTLGINKGLLQGDLIESHGTLNNEGTLRFNKAEMKAGSLQNKPGGDIDLGESNFILDSLINNSTFTFNKKTVAKVKKTSNTDCMSLLQESSFDGDSFKNTGTIAVDVFSLTMGEDLKQLKKMSAKRKLSLEARQIISDLNSETSSEQNLSVKTEKPLVSQGLWKGTKSSDLQTPSWRHEGIFESPGQTDIRLERQHLTNTGHMMLSRLSLFMNPGCELINKNQMTLLDIQSLSPGMGISNTGKLQIQMEEQDNPALLSLDPQEKKITSALSLSRLQTGSFSGLNAKKTRGFLDREKGLVYPEPWTPLMPDLFLPKEYTTDPMDPVLWEELRNYASEMNSAIKRDSSLWKESVFIFDPLCYITRNVLRDFLSDIYEYSRNYEFYTRSTLEKKIQDQSARHLQEVGRLKLGLFCNASFQTIKGNQEALNRGGFYEAWGWEDRFIPYEQYYQNYGFIPVGKQIAEWDKNGGITKKLVPRLMNKGLDFLKNTRQWFGDEASPYALTQNVKGNIAVSSPYVPLVYTLFADERLDVDAYLPQTYRPDAHNDSLREDIRQYVNQNLDKSQNKEGRFFGLPGHQALYHLDPLFYVTRQAVMFSDGRSKRDVAEQLQKAFAYHIFMTPLYTKDTKGEISKVLTLRLLDKGFAMFRDGSLKWLHLSRLANDHELILLGGTWHLDQLVNYKGSMIQLGQGTSLHYPSARNDGIIKGLENLEIEGDDNALKLWSLQAGKDLTFKLSDKVDAAGFLKDYRKYWKLNGTLTLDAPWFHHTDHTILPYPLRIFTKDFLNVGILQSPGMEVGGGGRFRNGLLSQQRWGELYSTDFMNIEMASVDNGWGRMRSEDSMFLHTLGSNIENGALVKTTQTALPAPYHLPYSRYGSRHKSYISDLMRGGYWIQRSGETPVKVHHGNQAVIFCNSDLTMIADHGNIHNDYGNIYSGGDMIASLPEGKFRTLAGNLWVKGNAHITGQRWSAERTPGESYLQENQWKGENQQTHRIHLDTSDPSSVKILKNLFLQVNETLIDGSSLMVGGQIYSDGKNPLNLEKPSSSFKIKGSHGGKPSVVMSKQKILINTGEFGLAGYREVGAQPVTQTIIIDLAEMAKAMMKQNPLIQIQKKKGLPRLTLGGESAEGMDPYKMMFDSQSPRGIPYMNAQVFQYVLMDVLASYAGTLNLKSVKELDWEGQTRALFRQGQKIAQKKQGALTQEDLKGLETSALVFKKQTIDGIDYEVAQFLLNPKDLNPLGKDNTTLTAPSIKVNANQSKIQNATLVANQENISLNVKGLSHMMGTLYGEKKVDHQADVMILERPVERYKEEVIEKQTTHGVVSSKTKQTKRIIERMIVLTGGRTLTGEEGEINLNARLLEAIGAYTWANKIKVNTSEGFIDHPLKEVVYDHYHVEKHGSYGGGYGKAGFVSREILHPSSWIAGNSLVMEHEGTASYQAPLLRLTKEGEIRVVAKKPLTLLGAKAVQENTPELRIKGTKILETIGSKEIAEFMRIEALLGKIHLESQEQISGVRPRMVSQTQEIKAPVISLMEEEDFLKTLQRKQQTFVVGSTVDPGVKLVMDLAITVACPAAGVIGSHFISSFIFNKGNLSDAFKEATSRDALKSLGTKVASAMIMQAMNLNAPVGGDFTKHLSYQMQKSFIETGTKAVIYQDNIEDALKDALKQGLLNSIASYGAQCIGEAFDTGKGAGDYLLHKTAHGLLGAAKGYVQDKSKEGALSGALGAVVAEVVAEQMTDRAEVKLGVEKQALKEGWWHDTDRINRTFRDKLQPTLDKTKLVAGMLALASGQNVDIALQTAANALEYNFKNYAAGKTLENNAQDREEALEELLAQEFYNKIYEEQINHQNKMAECRQDLKRIRGRQIERSLKLDEIRQANSFDPSFRMDRLGYQLAHDISHDRPPTPTRLKDTAPEKVKGSIRENIEYERSLLENMRERDGYEEQRKFFAQLPLKDKGHIMAAFTLEKMKDADHLLGEYPSFALSKLGVVPEFIGTQLRRELRTITGSQRIGQNVGDAADLIASLIGGGAIAKTGKEMIGAGKNLFAKKTTLQGLDLAGVRDMSNQGFYNPHQIRQYFENKYPGLVASTTVPSWNAKNVKLAGQRHPITGTVFDQKGLPIFDQHVLYDTKIPREIASIKKDTLHMKEATKDLKKQIETGKIDQTKFTKKQIEHIFAEKPKIDGLTWHHHQDLGRMQLIDETLHVETGHLGGMNLWFQH